ncbi:MAG TPA: hypothetical protein VGM32_22200 [Rhodopila sp.]
MDFIWDVTKEVLDRLGLARSDEMAAKSIGWSNLAKIGAVSGNPQGAHLRIQAPLCCEILKSEIGAWKPHVVVFHTSDFARDEILWPSIGAPETWEHSATEHVWFKNNEISGCPSIWTIYLGRKSNELWNAVQEATVSQMLRVIGSTRLSDA